MRAYVKNTLNVDYFTKGAPNRLTAIFVFKRPCWQGEFKRSLREAAGRRRDQNWQFQMYNQIRIASRSNLGIKGASLLKGLDVWVSLLFCVALIIFSFFLFYLKAPSIWRIRNDLRSWGKLEPIPPSKNAQALFPIPASQPLSSIP